MIYSHARRATRRWVGRIAAFAVVTALVSSALVTLPQASAQAADDLTVTAVPATIKKRVSASDPGFTLNVSDGAARASTDYILGGLPAGWTVTSGGASLSPISPEPILYSIPGAAARDGKLSVIPPVGYQGKLASVQLSRVSNSGRNLITDFDNGTFDYDGRNAASAQAKPKLPASNTPYGYKDPTSISGYNGTCGTNQYGPCDGFYSIWPTSNMGGPSTHYNNLWADLRSVSNPMTVATSSVCVANNSYMVPTATAETSGKFLVINGSEAMPVPNNLVVTTVTGLTPNTNYTFSGNIANLSYDSGAIAPVRSALFAGSTLIGSSAPSPKQSACGNASTRWTNMTSTVNTGSSTSLTLGVRNMGAGGMGNDLGIDDLSLYAMDSATFALDVKAYTPGLAVAKSANPASGTTVAADDLVTYSVRASNTGDATLTNVTVSDNLADVLDNADIVSGSLAATMGTAPTLSGTRLAWTGTLAPTESVTLTYQVKLTSEYRRGQVLANTVVSQAVDPSGAAVPSNCVTGAEVGCSTSHPIKAGVSTLTLTKQSDPPSGQAVTRGSTVTYTVTATNSGETPLTGVTVRDDLTGVLDDATFVDSSLKSSAGPAPTRTGNALAWTGDLAIGASVTLTYAVTVRTDFAAAATLLNRATATAINPDGDPVASHCVLGTEPGCFTTHAVPLTGVSIAKDDHTEIIGAGEDTSYDIVVTNTGDDTVTGVVITDVLPAELTFYSASAGGSYDAATRTVTWTIGSIPVGEKKAVAVTATVDPDIGPNQAISNTARVSSTEGCTTACTAIDVDYTPAISIVKDDHREVVRSGDVLTYDVVVTNNGDRAVDGIVATDVLPTNAEFVSASNSGTQSKDGTSVVWELGELAAHASTTVTVTVKVGAVSAGNTVVNNASVTTEHGCIDDPATPGDECSTTDTDVVPAISVTTTDHKTIVVPGDESTYDVVVTNRLPQVAPLVTATDVLPENFEFASADAGGTYDPTNRTVSWDLGDLPAGGSVTVHVTGHVSASAVPNETVTTTARAATDGMCADDLTTLVNECEASDTDRVPAISIVKDDGRTIVRSGETLVYTITASNLGDDEATNVVVRDTMPDNVDFVTSSVPATQSVDNPLAFEWNVGTIAPGATSIITVTVTVHEGLPADTTVVNSATITTEGVCVENPATEGTECESVDSDRLPSDVWILKDDHKTAIAPGEKLVYELTVGNNSTVNAVEDAVVTDALPTNVTFVEASDGGVYTKDNGVVTWKLPTLAPGATTTVTVTVTASTDLKPGATVVNMGSVVIPGGCQEPTSCQSIDVDGVVDLAITKDDHTEQIAVGEKLTYDLVVSNRGALAAQEVVVTDQLPRSLTFVSATDGGTYNADDHTVSFELGELGAGVEVTLQVSATVNADTLGLVTNSARITSAQGCLDEDACTASDTDVVQSLALTGASASLMGVGALLLVVSGVFLVARTRRRGEQPVI